MLHATYMCIYIYIYTPLVPLYRGGSRAGERDATPLFHTPQMPGGCFPVTYSVSAAVETWHEAVCNGWGRIPSRVWRRSWPTWFCRKHRPGHIRSPKQNAAGGETPSATGYVLLADSTLALSWGYFPGEWPFWMFHIIRQHAVISCRIVLPIFLCHIT